jgi:hypothetical protein
VHAGRCHAGHSLTRGSAASRLLGLRVRIPRGHGYLSLMSDVFCQRFMRRADLMSRGVLPSVVCLSVIVKPNNQEALTDEGLLCHGGYVFWFLWLWLFTFWSSGL